MEQQQGLTSVETQVHKWDQVPQRAHFSTLLILILWIVLLVENCIVSRITSEVISSVIYVCKQAFADPVNFTSLL